MKEFLLFLIACLLFGIYINSFKTTDMSNVKPNWDSPYVYKKDTSITEPVNQQP